MSDSVIPLIKVAFLDVGQADTIVISCTSTKEAIVVDCADAKVVLNYLEAEEIKYLRGIIITHLHEDHYRGVSLLLNAYQQVQGLQECEVVVFNEILNKRDIDKLLTDTDNHSRSTRRSLDTFLRNLKEWFQRGEERNIIRCASLRVERRSLPIDGILAQYITLVHPYMSDMINLETEGLNNTSGVLQIQGSGSSVLLTGDLEPKGWQKLKSKQLNLASDVVKFPHHGGAWQEVEATDLLDALKPSIVVISVGTDNTYNHPNPSVFAALHKRPDMRLLCTQATEQCGQTVSTARIAIEQAFQKQSSRDGSLPMLARQGCPCAGTVVIELGDNVHVLQPDLMFHQDSIVNVYFKDHHKCHLIGSSSKLATLVEVAPQSSDM